MVGPPFTLAQLEYFDAAVEHGSMTAAARALVVSQSAVSTAIAQLERELGVQLLLRHHAKGLTLTAAGREFHTAVRPFLSHAEELAESARSAGEQVVGRLTIGCFSTLAPFLLPQLLGDFAATHPEVEIHVDEAEHAQLKRGLRAGECELALMYGYDLDDDIDRIAIATAAPYVLVSANHRLAKKSEVRLHDLANDPFVLLDLPHTAGYFTSLLTDAGVEPNVRFRSPGFETVRSLVAQDLGFAILNQRPSAETTYGGGRVIALQIADEIPPLESVLAWMKGARLTRRAQAFIAVAGRATRSKSSRKSMQGSK